MAMIHVWSFKWPLAKAIVIRPVMQDASAIMHRKCKEHSDIFPTYILIRAQAQQLTQQNNQSITTLKLYIWILFIYQTFCKDLEFSSAKQRSSNPVVDQSANPSTSRAHQLQPPLGRPAHPSWQFNGWSEPISLPISLPTAWSFRWKFQIFTHFCCFLKPMLAKHGAVGQDTGGPAPAPQSTRCPNGTPSVPRTWCSRRWTSKMARLVGLCLPTWLVEIIGYDICIYLFANLVTYGVCCCFSWYASI